MVEVRSLCTRLGLWNISTISARLFLLFPDSESVPNPLHLTRTHSRYWAPVPIIRANALFLNQGFALPSPLARSCL